jgi:hypothetical protein
LAKDSIIAQQSLANQISKVREEFLALFREIGNSKTFQVLASGALSVASAIIKVVDSLKGVLPALAIIGAFKGFSALTQYATGFASNIGSQKKNGGGKIMQFARGGIVPGQGNSDTVPAMLMPGEFVIRKKAVETIGTDNLHKMNKYGTGGSIRRGRASKRQKFIEGGIAQIAQLGPGKRGEGYIPDIYNRTIQEKDIVKSEIIPRIITEQDIISVDGSLDKFRKKISNQQGHILIRFKNYLEIERPISKSKTMHDNTWEEF